MGREDDWRRDVQSALQDVERLRDELTQFSQLNEIGAGLREMRRHEADDLAQFSERVESLLQRLADLLARVNEAGAQGSSGRDALSLVSLVNELKAQLAWLEGLFRSLQEMPLSQESGLRDFFARHVAHPVQAGLATIRNTLEPLLKRLIAKVWQIICNLLTPKEWKLQGKIGTGILGLADVGIEITFGP